MTDRPPGLGGSVKEVVLRARRVTKAFDGKLANEDVEFAVRSGEVHALLGENGAGKTTLISILSGLYKPDAGEIEVRGVTHRFSSPRDALRLGIGVVHQDLRQVARFSVVENVVLGTSERVTGAAERRVAELSRELGFQLEPRATVNTLSIGERQQVEIVKLLYRGMSVLILDEPTSVLAPQQSEQLFHALRRLADQGKAVVLISHRLRDVATVGDVVTVMRDGCVVAQRPLSGASPADLAALMVGGGAPGVVPKTRSSPPGEPILELHEVACASRRRALHDLQVVVRRREIVGVAGVSGNGQDELAELAAGMRQPDGGERRCSARVVAFIPADRLATGLVAPMSIAENLAFRRFDRRPMSTPGWLRRARMSEHARHLVDRFRIPTDNPRVPVVKLSGGGLQRVIVAREMTESPDLLVAAQPTRGLDVVSAAYVRSELITARESGAGVLLISEDLDELLELSDRIMVMLGGRIVAELSRDEATRIELVRHMAGSAGAEPAS